MQAVVQDGHGGPDVLELAGVDAPITGDVLVRVAAAASIPDGPAGAATVITRCGGSRRR